MPTNKQWPKKDDCDAGDPQEHFLWALLHVQMGEFESMPIQPATARVMSKHLYELGFRHHPELQTKKLQMPIRGQQHPTNGLTRWVPMDAKTPDPLRIPNVRRMNAEERELLHQELRNVGHITDPPLDRGPLAQVTSASGLRPRNQRTTTAAEVMRE